MEGNELLNPEPKHIRDELSGDRSPVARQSRRRRSRTRSPAGGRDASLSPSAAARPRKVAVAKESAARRAAKRMNYERSSVALLQRQSRHAVKAAKVGGSSLCVCPLSRPPDAAMRDGAGRHPHPDGGAGHGDSLQLHQNCRLEQTVAEILGGVG